MAELQKAGINLTLQGEAQYIAGLRNVNREMDLMATNTKLAVAQLGMGATPTQKFSTQMRHMGAEIEKASTKTMVLRNRNKELPNEIFKTGKSLDGLKDEYEKQVTVLEQYRQKRDEVYKNNSFYSEDATKAREAFNEQQQLVNATAEEVKKLEGAYNGMLDEYERMPNSMAEAQLATQQLLNEQAKLREEYLKGGGVLTGFADKLESSGDKLQRYGRNISDIGDAFMGVTVGILAGGGGALKAFMDWEAALRGAMKTNDEVFDSNGNLVYSYEDLEMGLRELSKEIPVANTELAEFAEIAGRLQVPTDEVVGFTEVVAKLGETTNLTGEEAAEQLGKFINITGASTSSTLNLANALVELGNNTAASEQETLRMSTRWASTGDIIGMTDDQILALSASVISLGIRTEAGGSAVQRAFLKINDAVLEGGVTLATFAEQAGMSSSEFKKAWQDDAAHALIPFLKGLNDTHEAGGNVNGILKDLGITSVNELNTLLVLAGGYDQLAGNLEMASNAYNETEESMMALNKEAELAYGTTLGKLRTAWNRLKDSLIDIGEPIADAVLDMVDAAEPLFKVVEDLATGFSNLDESAQRDIISTVAKIALIAPALKIAGGAMTTLGDIFKVGAGVTRKAGEIITKAMFGVAGEAATLTTVAGTAAGSKGVGGLIASLAGSAGLPWALGIAAVALGGWTLWKVWGEDAYEAAEQTKLWGRTVSDETHETLTNFQELSARVRDATDEMANDVESGGKKAVQGYESMMEGIVNTADEKLGDITGFYEDLNTSAKHILAGSTENHSEELEKIKKKAKEKYDEINQIYAEAIAENRRLTSEELQQVEKLHADLAKLQAQATDGTAEQIRQTQASLMNDLKAMSEKQLLERRELLRKDLEVVKENHEAELEEIDKRVASGRLKYEDGEKAKVAIRRAHSREVQRIMDEQIKAFEASGMDEEAILLELMNQYSEYGYTRIDMERKVQEVMRGTQDETYELNRMWKNLLTDPVTGEVNTNLPDVLADMYESDETWQELHYMIKEADLSSNALEIIDEALVANGLWDELDPEIKVLLTDNRVFMHKLSQSEEALNRWNELPEEEKWILGNNHDIALKIMNSEQMYNHWLNLPEEDKHLLGNNTDLLRKVLGSEKEYNRWLRLPEKEKRLLANNAQIYESVNNAQRKIDSMRGKEVTIKTRFQSIYETINRAGNSASSQRAAQSGYTLGYQRGTGHHPGGPAMVNDQQGATFRELITLPDGSSFIPKGRNVMLDLPKGSKVLRAALTRMKFPNIPQYARGAGLQTATVPKEFDRSNGASGDSDLRRQMTAIISQLKSMGQTQSAGNVSITIENIENNSDSDIPRIMEEIAWMMKGEGNRLNG